MSELFQELRRPAMATPFSLCLNRNVASKNPSNSGHTPRPSRHNSSHHHLKKHSNARIGAFQPCHSWISLTTLLIMITCCSSLSYAATDAYPASLRNPLEFINEAPEEYRSALAQLAETGTIFVDPTPQPTAIMWVLETLEEERGSNGEDLRKRQKASTTSSSVVASSTTVLPPSPLPSVFDSGLMGTNFSSPSCPNFINSFLQSSAFKACLPFSMLELNSNSFFQASKSIVRITQVLDASCAANISLCTSLLSDLASNLTNPLNCGADLKAQVPLVVQAHTGLIAYRPLYSASCLKNTQTSSYCFADAITNATSPTDSYPYLLPLNVSLFGGSQPTCNTCLQGIMGIFSAAAANRSQAIASTYPSAAQQINVVCGPNFVNATIPAALVSGASAIITSGGSVVALLLAFCVAALLL